jgi:hypothetical protein
MVGPNKPLLHWNFRLLQIGGGQRIKNFEFSNFLVYSTILLDMVIDQYPPFAFF